MNPEIEIDRLIKEHNGVLVRQRKHQVWSFPDGKQVVLASTPSDRRAASNKLSVLRRVLGVKVEKSPQGNGTGKAAYRPKHQAAEKLSFTPKFNSSLADQLRLTGLVEDELRETIDCLEDEKTKLLEDNTELADALFATEQALKMAEIRLQRTWDWRIRQWLTAIFS